MSTGGPVARLAAYRGPGAPPPAIVLGDLSLVRPLALAGLSTLVVTASDSDPLLRSRDVRFAYVEPALAHGGPEALVDALLALAGRLGLGAGARAPLFYGSDANLEALLKFGDRLAGHYAFLLNEEPLGRALLDKALFAELGAERGLRLPRALDERGERGERGESAESAESAELSHALAQLRPPLLVKPKHKVDWQEMKGTLLGGGKARLFPSATALLAAPDFARFRRRVLVQEYIPGGPDSLRSFHAFADEHGHIAAFFCGRKIRTFPPIEGESSFIELIKDPELVAAGMSLAAKLGLRGVFKVDFKRDERSGELFVLEVNARFNLWNFLGAVDGVNLPAIAYHYLTSGALPSTPPDYTPRHRWVNLYDDFKSLRAEQRLGRLTFGQWLSSLTRGPNIYESFAAHDPIPALSWAAHHLGARFMR